MQKVSRRISGYLAKEQNLSQERIEIIAFGIESFITMVIGYVAIFLVGYLIGYLKAVVIISLVGFGLRSFSGGGHCSSWIRCSVAGAFFVPIIGWLSQRYFLAFNEIPLIIATIYLVVGLLIYLYAPRDNPTKPINTEKHRKKLKMLSLVFLIGVFMTQIFTTSGVSSAITYGVLWQTMSILPLGEKFIQTVDQLLIKVGIS